MKNMIVLELLFSLLLAPLLLHAKKFYNDDPLEKEPTPLHVEDARYRKLNDYYNFFLNTFGKTGQVEDHCCQNRRGYARG